MECAINCAADQQQEARHDRAETKQASSDAKDAFRHVGTAMHKGKVIITMD
jgi:hypothetical protein